MRELQDQVANFCKEYELDCTIEHRLLDVLSELGEVAKEYLTATNYGKKKFTPSSEWEVELGDLLFSVLRIQLMLILLRL